MKCEICKKNEAQFYYKESINGKTTEKHLCAECAHKEGLDRIFEHEANSMLTSFGKMMDSFLLPDVDFFGFGRLPSIGEMFEPLRTLSEHEPEAEMHEEADPLEAKAEEKGEEALGHKGEEPSVERTPSLHTALILPCRMNFPLRKTSLLQGNFYWRTL